MKSPLHILHLEDDPHDATLILEALQTEGIVCEATHVDNRKGFLAALEQGGIDLVLSDFALPAFDGLSATRMVRERWPDLPFILVSGTLGEELAIDSLKSGATDYVLKERLARLGPAVRRAMLEAETKAERRKLEAQIIEAQKMEVMGQLAGGVAHDFNNILGVIIGYSDLLTLEFGDLTPPLGDDHMIRRHNEEIRHASERAVGLTRQLLVFSSKETVQPVVLDLNAVVNDLDKMLRRLIDENITMTLVPGLHLGHVKADPGYLGQVLMNLVVNARDAMPNGGHATIATSNVTLDETHARTHPGAAPGEYVMLSVTDTGMGIPAEIIPRLFEAFFTTKSKGKGTGLGLATCHTIVRQSGGHIEVESKLGQGTTFKVYLPQVGEPLDAGIAPDVTVPLVGGSETLLVVEDDPAVRHLACGVLKTQGYEVLCASNGQEALNMVREHQGPPICLVVTDIVMPLMGGKVMAEWLKTTNPDLKILFTSGYTDGAITHDGVLDEGVNFLPKPYTPAALTRTVRELLGKAPMA